MIAMLEILKQGGILGLYPEGQISIHGVTIENGESIAKFIKKSAVPVVRILTGGAYLSNPPWAKTSRTGPIESKINIVLSKEQIQELSEEEILLQLQDSIYINTYEWQETKEYTYSGKNLAEGLENVLYLCPSCMKEFTITTTGDEVICENCGIRARYGKDGHFHWAGKEYFRQLEDWHLWQLKHEKAAVASDNNFSLSEQVDLAMLRQEGAGVEVVGFGTFTASRKAYHYTGTLNGQDVNLTFPASGIHNLPFDTGRNFQIYSKNLYYEFRPANPKWCMKIANICEGLYLSTPPTISSNGVLTN